MIKLRDGVILIKLVNLCEPGAVPDGTYKTNPDMNVYDKYDNIKKALEGAKKIGCQSETDADDVLDKNKGRDNDLLSEILARLNMKKPDIQKIPTLQKSAKVEKLHNKYQNYQLMISSKNGSIII